MNMDCEDCLRLWQELGRAVMVLRSAIVLDDTRGDIDQLRGDVLSAHESIELHALRSHRDMIDE